MFYLYEDASLDLIILKIVYATVKQEEDTFYVNWLHESFLLAPTE